MTSTPSAPPPAATPPAITRPPHASPAHILKDALATGVIALALAIPLVGFKTVERGSTTLLETRFGPMLCGVAVITLGRLAFSLINAGHARMVFAVAAMMAAAWPLTVMLGAPTGNWLPLAWMSWLVALSLALRAAYVIWAERAAARGELAPGKRVASTVQRLSMFLAPLLIAFAVAMPMLPLADQRWVDLGILVLTYIMLGWGLNVVVGLAGLLDLGYVAFYAIGAYSFAIFAKTFGLNFWEALPIAGLLAATFGVLLGFPVLRLRGDYLAIVTLGFGEIVRVVLLNWGELSNGPKGMGDIPRPSFFGMPFSAAPPAGVTSFHQWFTQHFWQVSFSPIQRAIYLYYIILALALLTNWFTLRIRKLPISLAWEALREDEIACRALGINPTSTKLTAFATGAMFGGLAGAFFATRQGFISPESFNFMESAIILAIVVLGGMGSQVGVVIASILLIGGPEWFRDLESYRMLAFGALMVLIMIWRPQGLLAFREPTIRLEPVSAKSP
jgi:branched-chain amino acid transport system permease protein